VGWPQQHGASPEGAKETMPHTTTNPLVHLIFSTKQRCALIKPDFENDLHAYLGGIIRQIGGTALCINGTRDHVHLLVRVPADHSVAEIARLIKTNSSRWVHGRWPEHQHFAWQTGYGAFTVSESGLGAVRDYISNQQEHHRKRSFQEEFLAFLKKNGITVDERYLWG
jgi:REP element-mobilizing transposase RayT